MVDVYKLLYAYNDIVSKEPHRQVDVGIVVTLGSLCGVMASTLA